ncbi:MAG: carboxypeptidase M32 [Planctomycetota bacterium]
MTTAYDKLIAKTRERHLLGSTAQLLGWDQQALMPEQGIEFRARQLQLLARLVHRMLTDPELGDLLAAANDELAGAAPESVEAVNVRELQRLWDRSTRVPEDLVAELSEVESLAQHEWAKARAADDFARFLPWLERLVTLERRKAEALGVPEGGELWDALGDLYETGMRAAALESLFRSLRQELVGLLEELRAGGTPPARSLDVPLPIEDQRRFVRFASEAIGFDYTRGRLDVSTHPFCSGSQPRDVRLTTRFTEDELFDALYSTLHESGHGIYEQGLRYEHAGTPMGLAVSLGVHESQSRLWENTVARSRAFWDWLTPRLGGFFGARLAGWSAEDLWRAANIVQPSLIRVEADELTYNLHVMVRFELELLLFRGELEPRDVPAAWNERYRDYLGIEVPDDRRGCLQDVHWSAGLFGYFPTYTLGNLYAAQLYAKAEAELGPQAERFREGDFTTLRTWLGERVHRQGQRWLAPDLVREVTGADPDPAYLITALRTKLRDVYRVA